MNNFTTFTKSHWEEEIRAAVIEEMAGLRGFQEEDLTIAIDVVVDDHDLFRVAVDVTYPFRTIIDWPALPNRVDLHYRSEMRRTR